MKEFLFLGKGPVVRSQIPHGPVDSQYQEAAVGVPHQIQLLVPYCENAPVLLLQHVDLELVSFLGFVSVMVNSINKDDPFSVSFRIFNNEVRHAIHSWLIVDGSAMSALIRKFIRVVCPHRVTAETEDLISFAGQSHLRQASLQDILVF